MRKQILSATVAAACLGLSIGVAGAEENTTNIGGKAYFDLTNINQKNDGTKAASSGIGVDVKRFYFSVTHGFDDMWSANLTTDFDYVGGDSQTQVFVKKAYVQAKFSDAAVVRAGSADLPWVPFVEGIYPYRYVELTLIDRLKFGTSADWGVHFSGKVMNGMVSYAVSAVNGNGYKNPTRSKSVDLEGRVAVKPVKGVTVAAAVRTGKLGQDIQGASTPNTATRYDLLAAYEQSMFNVGLEYFNADNGYSGAVKGTKDKADGYSLWGVVKPMEKVAVFARYDYAKPRKDTYSSLKDTYYNVGVSYEARKNVDLALVYKHEKISGIYNGSSSNSDFSTSNVSTLGANNTKFDEIGIWSQVKF